MTSRSPSLLRGLLIAGLAALVLSGVVLAAVGELSIPWFSVDSGGGLSQGGDFTLRGAIGQPDAGAMVGEGYRLAGGFLAGVTNSPPAGPDAVVYIPLVIK